MTVLTSFINLKTLHHLLVLNAITDTASVGNTGVRVRPGSRGTTRAQLTFKHHYINTLTHSIEMAKGRGDTFKTAKRDVQI